LNGALDCEEPYLMPLPTAAVETDVLRAALVGVDQHLGYARRAKAQIEAEALDQPLEEGGYEDAHGALEAILEDLYELLVMTLEAVSLPKARIRLIRQWRDLTRTAKPGAGHCDHQYDYFDSPTFKCIERTIDNLRLFAGDRPDTRQAYELQKLDSILRKTATILQRVRISPASEREVRDPMHEVLFACFTQYTTHVNVPGILKTFVPDCGVRDLQAAIEFKFAASRDEVLKAVGGIFEDGAGYHGSRDWTQFYSVIYQTAPFESEDRVRSEMVRGGLLTWTSILVTGTGARSPRSSSKPAARKSSRAL
jgi:hypothetical protein